MISKSFLVTIIARITSVTGMSSIFTTETYGSQILDINLERRDNLIVCKTEGLESTFTDSTFLALWLLLFC